METQFKPFDKVLVRDKIEHKWQIELFGKYSTVDPFMQFECLNGAYKFCIPFEGNEHLLGTTDDYVEPFEPKKGDFVTITNKKEYPNLKWIAILLEVRDDSYYCLKYISTQGSAIMSDGNIISKEEGDFLEPSTEEEKQKLLDALHEEGRDWDAEKKEIVVCKWKPKEGEEFYSIELSCIGDFYLGEGEWVDNDITNILYEKGWVFKTKEEGHILCDKLNEAIKNVK